jgi:hypothetical protein
MFQNLVREPPLPQLAATNDPVLFLGELPNGFLKPHTPSVRA